MKKINLYIAILGVLFFFSACNDEWKDELYVHMVSLKAPVGDEGVADIYLRYHPDGEVIYDLPVLRSGSTLADNAVEVRIGVDNDTLSILNNDKYQFRTDLYYNQLPEKHYELLSSTCLMPAGSNKELFQVKFKFAGLDLSHKWVLPLTIEEDPSYVTNYRKGWRKALLHVLPFNDYSGKYSATNMNIYFADSNNDPLVVDERVAHVVDENTVFFYAGTKEDNAYDRTDYKINVKFVKTEENEDGSEKGILEVTPVSQAINFRVVGNPTYEITEEMDPNLPYLKFRRCVIRMNYIYDDITSASEPISYRAEGSMVMERKINTLIPDEDQAIQW